MVRQLPYQFKQKIHLLLWIMSTSSPKGLSALAHKAAKHQGGSYHIVKIISRELSAALGWIYLMYYCTKNGSVRFFMLEELGQSYLWVKSFFGSELIWDIVDWYWFSSRSDG